MKKYKTKRRKAKKAKTFIKSTSILIIITMIMSMFTVASGINHTEEECSHVCDEYCGYSEPIDCDFEYYECNYQKVDYTSDKMTIQESRMFYGDLHCIQISCG